MHMHYCCYSVSWCCSRIRSDLPFPCFTFVGVSPQIEKVKMSGKALRDLNVLPASGLDKNSDISGKGSLAKTYIENINDNGHELQKKNYPSFSATINKVDIVRSNELETVNTEVEYIDSENLADIADVDASFNGTEGIKAYGIDKLIQVAAAQLSDQLPESREAARALAIQLQTIYVDSQVSQSEDSVKLVDADSWEAFCHAKLTPLSAQAILRVTATPKEALAVSYYRIKKDRDSVLWVLLFREASAVTHSADADAELPFGVNGAGGTLVLVLQDLPAHLSTPLGSAGVEHHAADALCKIRRHAHRHQQHHPHRERTDAWITHYSLKCIALRGTKHRLLYRGASIV
ncbi:hypothetical protein BHE74_00002594 [Ensete ventricosum]|nr:hypothetical protein BHE74_00002594 [Ensete ventricosum]